MVSFLRNPTVSLTITLSVQEKEVTLAYLFITPPIVFSVEKPVLPSIIINNKLINNSLIK
jgi:hypothetical protein